jgi:hypothetical protein
MLNEANKARFPPQYNPYSVCKIQTPELQKQVHIIGTFHGAYQMQLLIT